MLADYLTQGNPSPDCLTQLRDGDDHDIYVVDFSERVFGLETLGDDMQGSAMRQTLRAAYDKLFAADRYKKAAGKVPAEYIAGPSPAGTDA